MEQSPYPRPDLPATPEASTLAGLIGRVLLLVPLGTIVIVLVMVGRAGVMAICLGGVSLACGFFFCVVDDILRKKRFDFMRLVYLFLIGFILMAVAPISAAAGPVIGPR